MKIWMNFMNIEQTKQLRDDLINYEYINNLNNDGMNIVQKKEKYEHIHHRSFI